MALPAAARGLVVFLLCVTEIQCESDWGVTYTSAEICAAKGSSVDMSCTYRYPTSKDGIQTYSIVTQHFWHLQKNLKDLSELPKYSGHVTYPCSSERENVCCLRITNLTESDSAEYMFRFITNQPGGSWSGVPGVKLTVSALQIQVTRVNQSSTEAELSCHSNCNDPSYVWFKNGQKVPEEASSYTNHFNPGDNISCALKGHEDSGSPSLYAPKLPSVSVSPGEIMKGSSVNLSCSSDANPAANYTWYKINQTLLSEGPQLVFSSIRSSDSGQYHCAAENELRRTTSANIFINVKYGPKLPSVSVSPSAEIEEGSSVTLSCSSDANPAANYTWYKEDGNLKPLSEDPQLVFSSIQSSDSGQYQCRAQNKLGMKESKSISIDVKYGPKLPSVSVSPSAEIEEGSSVTLSCSSDANPAANYTWYKEDEDSPKASGQNFTITDFRSEHSGNYYCEAQNSRGRRDSTLHLTVGAGQGILSAVVTMTAVLIIFILISVALWVRLLTRKEGAPKPSPEPKGGPDKPPAEQKDTLHYAVVHFSKRQADPINPDTRPALPQIHTSEEKVDSVEYATVKCNGVSTAPG
ncbi:B-cell receptor CD22-like isoform X2 [Cottoperca gobio]|uniref:B-cell receptor CD22 n=1 Tax=Cottoperca gobio TaxID=56716 RepID=A0A6J2PCA4_COTGO|nr:B-cell receptor CD22-like isoform X2 [Cottoperca gobio]